MIWTRRALGRQPAVEIVDIEQMRKPGRGVDECQEVLGQSKSRALVREADRVDEQTQICGETYDDFFVAD